MIDQQTFDPLYFASLPPQLLDLFQTTTPEVDHDGGFGARMIKAEVLAQQGLPVDVPIQVWRMDPWGIMNLRIQYAYTTVPAANGMPITVSLDPKAYPPFAPPTPPAPPPTHPPDWVGPWSGMGDRYWSMPGDPTPDGGIVKDPRGTFLRHYHTVQSPFGKQESLNYYQLLPPSSTAQPTDPPQPTSTEA
jgi:hypothetical protein